MAAITKSTKKKKDLIKGPQTEVTTEVLDFIRALDDYKKTKNRPFPTWSEVLEVLKQLGYRQVEEARPIGDIGDIGENTPQKTTKKAPKKSAKKAVKKGTKKAKARPTKR